MDQRNQNSPPVYAEITDANDDRTAAVLVLFGRRVRREFHGPRHLSEARAWVAGWNEHLCAEWCCVKETTATIMDAFTDGLTRRGVRQDVINATLKELAHYGE